MALLWHAIGVVLQIFSLQTLQAFFSPQLSSFPTQRCYGLVHHEVVPLALCVLFLRGHRPCCNKQGRTSYRYPFDGATFATRRTRNPPQSVTPL